MATKDTKKKNGLVRQNTGTLSSRIPNMSIGALERALLKKFPAADAEEWDRTGTLVGDPAAMVDGVAVALDPTVGAIKEAQALGANVLITHHPAYLTPPSSFSPHESVACNPGAGVWAAIENKVSLMCFHTALDVSQEAARVLPGMLRLTYKGILEPVDAKGKKGYGQICTVNAEDAPLSLGHLGARCVSVFGRPPRVWGDFNQKITKAVTCTGSAGELSVHCLDAGVDVLVCGEIRYHDALSASQAGLAIIELGHDVSELPLVATLATAIESVGVAKDKISIVDQNSHWSFPESIRV